MTSALDRFRIESVSRDYQSEIPLRSCEGCKEAAYEYLFVDEKWRLDATHEARAYTMYCLCGPCLVKLAMAMIEEATGL